jgi:acetyl-CoA synthetase
MPGTPIRKVITKYPVQPNLVNYEQECRTFTWEQVRKDLAGLPSGGLNIAYEAVDRQAEKMESCLALRCLGKKGSVRDFTYGDLRDQTNRFANVLRRLKVGRSERVFALSGRVPALYVAALGTLKNGSVFCPLFSAFGPEPIQQRLKRGDAKVLLTDRRLYERRVASLRQDLPELQHVLLIDADDHLGNGIWSLPRLMEEAPTDFQIADTQPEDMALLHFTSGTTGMPKGAIHVHNAILMHHATAKYALDLHAGDVFWCTADPGWVTGTSYGIIAPLLHQVTNIVDEADFDGERWYSILEREKVNVWYTAPTAIRMLMRIDNEPVAEYDLSHLRFVASVGEPLNPEAVVWGSKKLGLPIHDNWWQTETGGIMIANYPAMDVRPGSRPPSCIGQSRARSRLWTRRASKANSL